VRFVSNDVHLGSLCRCKDSLVRLFRKGVELSDGVIESLLGKVTSSVGAVQDLVARKHEEQEWVNGCHLSAAPRLSAY
jgi:hypothetical protein